MTLNSFYAELKNNFIFVKIISVYFCCCIYVYVHVYMYVYVVCKVVYCILYTILQFVYFLCNLRVVSLVYSYNRHILSKYYLGNSQQ